MGICASSEIQPEPIKAIKTNKVHVRALKKLLIMNSRETSRASSSSSLNRTEESIIPISHISY